MQSGRVGAAIQKQRSLSWTGTSPAEHGNGLVRGIKLSARFDYDQGSIQPAGKLFFIVQMRVVHESPGTRRRKSDEEGVTGLNLGSDFIAARPPACRSVVIAFHFHAVPMNRS